MTDRVSFLMLLLGVRGIFATLVSMPIYLFWAKQRFEPDFTTAGFPNTNEFVVMLGAVLVNWVYSFGMTLAIFSFSPLWLAMIDDLNMPVSLMIDSIYNGLELSWTAWIGGSMVLITSFAVTLFDHFESAGPNVAAKRRKFSFEDMFFENNEEQITTDESFEASIMRTPTDESVFVQNLLAKALEPSREPSVS